MNKLCVGLVVIALALAPLAAEEALTISNTGKVGINTTDPQTQLEVTGDVKATGDTVFLGNVSVNESTPGDSGNLTVAGDLTVDGNIIYTGNVDSGTMDTTPNQTVFHNRKDYYINRLIIDNSEYYGDPSNFYILLHKVFDGTPINDHYVFGQITARRGSVGQWNRKIVSNVYTSSAYKEIRGYYDSIFEEWGLHFVRYGGVSYVAVKPAVSSTIYDIEFTGWAYAYDGELLKAVGATEVTNVSPFKHLSNPDGSSLDARYLDSDLYINGTSFSRNWADKTPYPKDLETAYAAVNSMERLPDGEYDENNKEHQLDHSKLHPYLKVTEDSRDLSAAVSCLAEVVQDMDKRLKELESENLKLKELLGMNNSEE